MDLHLRGPHLASRPDWAAAVVAGFVGGAVLMVLEMLWAFSITGGSSWSTSHMIAGILMGPDVAGGSSFDVVVVAVALFTHYLLGILFGLILAAIIAPYHLDSGAGMALVVGAVAGFVLYLINFHGMTAFFPWFAKMRGGETMIAHMIFGMATAWAYLYLERRQVLL
jgi:hypothetical protein